MDKKSLMRKLHPWRNCIATLLTILLVAACVILLSRSRNAMSLSAIRSSDIFRRYNFTYPDYEYNLPLIDEEFHRDFNQTYGSLYGESSRFNLGEKISLGDGDIVGIHSGGRSRNSEGFATKGSDERRWVDARIALSRNPRVNFYGAGSVGIQTRGNGDNAEQRPSVSSDSLSVGGGFGFSYRLGENTELLFDYRQSTPLDENSPYPKSDSAGFSLRFSF